MKLKDLLKPIFKIFSFVIQSKKDNHITNYILKMQLIIKLNKLIIILIYFIKLIIKIIIK